MLFSDHLTREDIQRVNNLRKAIRNQKEVKPKVSTKQPVKVKKQERLSRRDLEDLMGVHKDTYKRERGAVKRR
jgi:hypothetical protein